jgi:hypothetical protein
VPKQSDPTTILLNEYNLCQSSAQALEATIWQSAGLIGLVGIGTLTLVATSEAALLPTILVGAFSTAGSIIWWRMAKRWWSIEHAKFRRMRHIESILGLPGQMHYVSFLDDLHHHSTSAPVPANDPRVATLADRYSLPMAHAMSIAALQYHRAGPMDILNWFPALTAVAWSAYVFLVAARLFAGALHISVFLLPFVVW